MCFSSKPKIQAPQKLQEPAPPPEEQPDEVAASAATVEKQAARRKKTGINSLTIPLGAPASGTSGLNIPV